jgi:hypothetical protein
MFKLHLSPIDGQVIYQDKERPVLRESKMDYLAALARSTHPTAPWPITILVNLWRRRHQLKSHPVQEDGERLTPKPLTAE